MLNLLNLVKVIFKDYPDKTTPINASNLNNIQNNVKTAVDTVITSINNANDIKTTELQCEKSSDGQACYRKMLVATKSVGTDLIITLPTGATNVFVENAKLISTSGIQYVVPFYNSTSVHMRLEINSANTQIKVIGGTDSNYSAGTVYIVIRYTKT